MLVLGGTGMLGTTISGHLTRLGHEVITAARHQADIKIDLTSEDSFISALFQVRPEIIINSAAVVSLDACENEPLNAWKINAKAVSLLANYSAVNGCKLVQISTDHYYTGDKSYLHKETDPVVLLNEYARTKYAAECFALCSPNALVVRTNVTGFKQGNDSPTFAQWLFESIEDKKEIILFEDFYTSTIDAKTFSRVLAALISIDYSGLVNVASRSVSSKKMFAFAVAQKMGIKLDWAKAGSVKELNVTRAESLGLDVALVTSLLGYEMPSLHQVVDSLYREYRREI
jgi:dTDP-4-dehydrorhamnose reductase